MHYILLFTFNKHQKDQNHIDLFNESLDELENIINKFRSLGYTVIAGGDANDSEKRRNKLTKDFFDKNNLNLNVQINLQKSQLL